MILNIENDDVSTGRCTPRVKAEFIAIMKTVYFFMRELLTITLKSDWFQI